MYGDPSAILKWAICHRNKTTIRQLTFTRPIMAARGLFGHVIVDISSEHSNCSTLLQKFTQRATCFGVLRREPVHFDVSFVDNNRSVPVVKHHQALVHAVNGGIELQFPLLQEVLCFKGAQQTEAPGR
jgi:hypothetical protein